MTKPGVERDVTSQKDMKQTRQQKVVRALTIVMTCLVFVTSVILVAVSVIPDTNGPFAAGSSSLLGQTEFRTRLLPAVWTMAVLWTLTYVHIFLFLVYAVSTLCRPSPLGGYLYYSPPYLSTIAFMCLAVSSILEVVWLYLASVQMIWESFVVYLVIAVLLTVGKNFAQSSLHKYKGALRRSGKKAEVTWAEILMINAIGMNLAWIAVLICVSLSVVLVYELGVAMQTSCLVGLGVLAAWLLVQSAEDNTIKFEKGKYVYSELVLFHVALVGILINNYRQGDTVTIVTIATLALAMLLLIVKITWYYIKSRRQRDKIVTEQPRKERAAPIYVYPEQRPPVGQTVSVLGSVPETTPIRQYVVGTVPGSQYLAETIPHPLYTVDTTPHILTTIPCTNHVMSSNVHTLHQEAPAYYLM